ncbi:hypothetical protein FE783_09100 [Paenibacillus mesophilus]|uniref:glycosyl hydrolase family 28-related protein n=1 Tax=Paenibacillus mesophilus TaxID=2582849 RepID=UPI00110D8106|nr:glycosyl hydrolase family 28-related protein [Paenibacillus mesophilus]TMV50818.1 hypothetical protein FE783_09100 [Paenibacillus mesophilus]
MTNVDENGKTISRRALLASMGAAGAVFAGGVLLSGRLADAAVGRGSSVSGHVYGTPESCECGDTPVHVKCFGAKGDGVTDDTASIRDAIESIRAAGGGTLLFPSGVYGISGTITLYSGISVVGEAGTVIRAIQPLAGPGVAFTFDGKSLTNIPVLYAESASDIHLSRLTVDANRAVQTAKDVSAILFRNCEKASFHKVKAMRNKAASGGSYSGGAFNLFGCTYSGLVDCEVDEVQTEGLLLRECTHITVRGGEYRNSDSSCIGTQYGSCITIDGVTAHDSANSTISLNSSRSKIVGSTVFNSRTWAPIHLGHRTSYTYRKPADQSLVANNFIYGGYASGIIISYGRDIIVEANVVSDCRGAYDAGDTANAAGGIEATNWVDGLNIVGNTVRNCNRGIHLKFGKSDTINQEYTYGYTIVSNNIVHDNVFSGIQVNSPISGVQVVENLCYRNNVENHAARGELAVNFDGSLMTGGGGDVAVCRNRVGDRSGGRTAVNGLVISWSSAKPVLTVKPRVEGNAFIQCTNAIALKSYSESELLARSNIADGAPIVRTYAGNPNGVVLPGHLGEELLDTINQVWYKSVGTGVSDWKAL